MSRSLMLAPAIIALAAFAVGQWMPGLGMIVVLLGTTAMTALVAGRERSNRETSRG